MRVRVVHTAILQCPADAAELRDDQRAAEGDIDHAFRDRNAHAVVYHAHEVRRTAEAAHDVLGDIERIDALGIAGGTARERAVTGAELHEHRVQVELATQALQLALGIALAARDVVGAETKPACSYAVPPACYQHMPS